RTGLRNYLNIVFLQGRYHVGGNSALELRFVMQQKDAPVACGLQRLRYGHGRLPARQPDIEDVTASLAYRRVVIGNQTKHVKRLGKLTKPSRFRHARGTNHAADPAAPPMKLSLQIAP